MKPQYYTPKIIFVTSKRHQKCGFLNDKSENELGLKSCVRNSTRANKDRLRLGTMLNLSYHATARTRVPNMGRFLSWHLKWS